MWVASTGRQSKLPFRPSLFPHPVWMAVMAVLEVGATNYGVDNWRLISVADHIEHVRVHIDLWLSGDRTEPHLIHALCRLAFAAALGMDDTKEG